MQHSGGTELVEGSFAIDISAIVKKLHLSFILVSCVTIDIPKMVGKSTASDIHSNDR